MELKFNKDGTVVEGEANGGAYGITQEVNTVEDAEAVQAEVMPDERPQKSRAGWNPVTGKAEAPTTRALVPAPVVPRGALSRRGNPGVETSDDSISLGEIQIPTLNIVQGVGQLMETFDPGAIIYGKEHQLANPPSKNAKDGNKESTPVVELIVIGFRPTRWAEKIAGGEQGRICNSEEYVYTIGGTTDYNEAYEAGKQVKAFFQPLATALVLVRAPENFDPATVEDTFPFECAVEGKSVRYALASWHLRGTGFTNGAKPLKTERKLGKLKGGYTSRVVHFTTLLKHFGTNKAYIPVLRIRDATTDEQRVLAREVLESLTSN